MMSETKSINNVLKNFKFDDEELQSKAVANANSNWYMWKSVFPTEGATPRTFNQLPLFQSYPSFLGFGFDYSVFRRLKRTHLPKIWDKLREQSAPSDPEFLNCELKKYIKKLNGNEESKVYSSVNNFSLCSKLMTLWKPDKYYMIDTMNRKGLAHIFRENSTKGYKFSASNADQYVRLKKVFDEILRREELFKPFDDRLTIPNKSIARRRFLDAYFVNLGKLQAEKERANSKTGKSTGKQSNS